MASLEWRGESPRMRARGSLWLDGAIRLAKARARRVDLGAMFAALKIGVRAADEVKFSLDKPLQPAAPLEGRFQVSRVSRTCGSLAVANRDLR